MTPKTIEETSVGWMLPKETLKHPPSFMRENCTLPKPVSAKDEDNSGILMFVEKRKAILDSFYDD